MMQCKICNSSFSSERSLHAHLKKHKISLPEYYMTHYPRKNLLTGTLLAFKDKEEYFNRDFDNRDQLLRWCETQPDEVVKPYIKNLLEKRIKDKDLDFGPNHLELETHNLPSIDLYKKHFGAYWNACDQVGVRPIFARGLTKDFYFDYSAAPIFIDTREQKPLKFKNQREVKLDFGDYTTGGDFYTKTFVDRKSEGDFKSTFVGENLERFRRELIRCVEMDSYLYIVVESSLKNIEANNSYKSHKANLKFIYHNMRILQHEFAGHCQFIFSGSRSNSEVLIPKLLCLGNKLWETDLQYFIDKDLSWLGSKEIKKDKIFSKR